MVNAVNSLVWNTSNSKSASSSLRGNYLVVSHVMQKDNVYGNRNKSSTKCVWPGSLLTTDSRYLSRRLVVK